MAWGLNAGEGAMPQQGLRQGLIVHLAPLHSNCGSVARYRPFRLIGVTEGESHRLPDVGSQPWKTARQAESTLTYPSTV